MSPATDLPASPATFVMMSIDGCANGVCGPIQASFPAPSPRMKRVTAVIWRAATGWVRMM